MLEEMKTRKTIKIKKMMAVCMAATVIAGNSMTVFAVPLTMSDGTVFDAEYYARNNPDVVAVYGTDTAALFSHYQSYGRAEGRAPAENGAVSVGDFVDKTQTEQKKTEQAQQSESEESETKSQDVTQEEQAEAERLAQYYKDSVFIGDSIMLGFRNYSAKKTNFVHGIQFLAAGSYSAGNALKPVEGDNVHPKYKGKKYQVWDAVSMMGSRRVFILLGMNDIALLGLEGARDAYKEVIDKIVEKSPDVEITVISVTYTLKGEGTKVLNNDNIAKYNVLLKEMAKENGWEYLDLCTPVSDGKGNLAEGYCSDGFVHLSTSAYDRWEKELIKYEKLHPAQEEEAEEEAEVKAESASKTKTENTGTKAKTETKVEAKTGTKPEVKKQTKTGA
jgi:lysophospholipase L1-like esterase